MLKLEILALCHFFLYFYILSNYTTTTNLNTFVLNCYYPLKIQEFVQKLFQMIVLTFVYLLSSSSLDGGAD